MKELLPFVAIIMAWVGGYMIGMSRAGVTTVSEAWRLTWSRRMLRIDLKKWDFIQKEDLNAK